MRPDMAPNEAGVRPRRMVVGISGASGVIYGVRLLTLLRSLGVETHVVMSRSANARTSAMRRSVSCVRVTLAERLITTWVSTPSDRSSVSRRTP